MGREAQELTCPWRKSCGEKNKQEKNKNKKTPARVSKEDMISMEEVQDNISKTRRKAKTRRACGARRRTQATVKRTRWQPSRLGAHSVSEQIFLD